ncbi:MAG: RnfH family protein, partial [Steroidobacteraceae bacterium]
AGLAVYGREVGGEQPVEDGVRVEILRPLLEDPKSRRRRRAGR